MKRRNLVLIVLIICSLFISLAACSKKSNSSTIKLGLVGENSDMWDHAKAELAKEGIEVEYVKFSNYTLVNKALADKEIDVNSFQHIAFLEKEKEAHGYKLGVIGNTIIAPLGLYSKSIKNVDELKEADKIAIPNDPTNGGRALKVLEAAGIIKVDPKAKYTPTLEDITDNPKKIEFVEVEAAITPSLLKDVAAAIINGQHAVDNDLSPTKDSIYLEEASSDQDNPYINVLVSRADETEKEEFKKMIKFFQSDATKKILSESYKDAYLPAW